jgi:circadian clock protein KaiB
MRGEPVADDGATRMDARPREDQTREPGPGPGDRRHVLTLFVSGASDLSVRAVTNARDLCDVHVAGECVLSVVDVHQDPGAASSGMATPTLVRDFPLPTRRYIGDLARTDEVMRALDLPPSGAFTRAPG